ncbi:kinase-like domain-containing protein, partial [Gautieria morchelliformis]
FQDPQMIGYISTCYYHAPEIMWTFGALDAYLEPWMHIWSPGCIFAEMFEGKPLLPGKDRVKQFSIITELLGIISSGNMLWIVQSLAKREHIPFHKKLQCMDETLNLLEKMLVYDPRKYIMGTHCLAEEYVSPYHAPNNEPVMNEKFD